MTFRELLAFLCASISPVVTVLSRNFRPLGGVTDSGLETPTQSTPLVQATHVTVFDQ